MSQHAEAETGAGAPWWRASSTAEAMATAARLRQLELQIHTQRQQEALGRAQEEAMRLEEARRGLAERATMRTLLLLSPFLLLAVAAAPTKVFILIERQTTAATTSSSQQSTQHGGERATGETCAREEDMGADEKAQRIST